MSLKRIDMKKDKSLKKAAMYDSGRLDLNPKKNEVAPSPGTYNV
jgi:hypothetical protein